MRLVPAKCPVSLLPLNPCSQSCHVDTGQLLHHGYVLLLSVPAVSFPVQPLALPQTHACTHAHTHCHQHPSTESFLCCSPFFIAIIITPSQQPLPTPPLPPPVTVKIALIMSSILFPPSTLCTNLYYRTSHGIACFCGAGLSVCSLGGPQATFLV